MDEHEQWLHGPSSPSFDNNSSPDNTDRGHAAETERKRRSLLRILFLRELERYHRCRHPVETESITRHKVNGVSSRRWERKPEGNKSDDKHVDFPLGKRET
jgi:hypothetical protein